jgi:site-specific DNA-methyltransferase (adenine-specific)
MIRLSETATLFHADCREVLRTLPGNSIDSCCTDPPYALVSIIKRFGAANAAPAKGNEAYVRASTGFMGKQWDTGETAFTVEFWAEVLRVLKPGAFVAAFGATRGYHRMACAVEDAGFEIRDSLAWLYGVGFPKSHNMDGEWEGFGTALKPAFEPIVLARKPLSEKTVAANMLRWRTGALNIDASRIHAGGSEAKIYTSKRLQPGATAVATGEHMGRQKIVYEGVTKAGRWPANVVLTFPEDTFTFTDDANEQQRAEVETWLAENT